MVESLPLPLPTLLGGCLDVPGWTNGRSNKTCTDYASSYCAGGALRQEFAWLGGDVFGSSRKSSSE